ncbi:hypothetical protein HDU91_002231, partial [Kappamyces sp. JEL0680]
MPMDVALKALEHIRFDPYFQEFYDWSIQEGYPLTILSSGLKPLLDHFLGLHLQSKLDPSTQVVANDLVIHPGSHWEIVYLDDSDYGHDKGTALRKAKESLTLSLPAPEQRPLVVFVGD